MAKFDIKTVKPKFVVTTSPENKIDVVVNKPIIETKLSKSFFKLKNTGGPKGVKGDKGEPGQDSTIEVVSTTTGAAGTNASVVNQGTASAAQLAFTIPRGDKGDKGNDGAAGYSPTATVSKSGDTATITITDKNGTTTASISDGQDGAAGAPGQDGQSATIEVASTSTLPAGSSATVTNVGTSSAARLAFGIPKGDTGEAGADGDAATITVGQVETLQPNQPAYVTNVGTSEAAIFNIGIPKGDKGDSGSGSGDMTASVYDPNGTVAAAGGIPDYVTGELPTVNDATLTIKKNGTTVSTFTANSSSNVTANIAVPTDTSDLTNGAGYITSSALPTKTSDLQNDGADGTSTYVEADELGAAAFSNEYSDLNNTPTIPTVNNGTLTITQNGASKGTFTANSSSNETIALTDTTYSDFTGATSMTAGAAGLVPAPTTSDPDKFLKGDGTWATVQAGSSGLVLYANNSLHTPSSITGVYVDSGLTTMANTSDMIATIDDGGSVVIKYSTDEAVALTSYDDHASSSPSTISFTGQFLSNWKTNSPEFIKFTYDSTLSTWSAGGASLPTVNDATLTIQHNGTNVQTFTANQSTNATANIETIWADDIAPATQVPPITNELIDWPTMEHWSITLSENKTVTQGSSYNYVDVPDGSITISMTVGGVYLVMLNASVRCNGGSTDVYARALANGSQAAVGVSQNQAAGTFATVSSAQLFTATQTSNTFKLQIGGGRANSDYMIAGGLISSVQIIRIA